MDKAGLLCEGFDKLNSMNTWYHYPYQKDHLETLGFSTASEWLEFAITIPIYANSPEKVKRISKIVLKRYSLKVLQFKSTKELIPFVDKMFDLLNNTYNQLESFVPIQEEQINYYKEKYFQFIDQQYIKCITRSDGKLIAFAVILPLFSKALKKANGLKSDMIRDGKVLSIPTIGTQSKTITKTEYIPLDLKAATYTNDYFSTAPLDKIVVVPNQEINEFALNGLVLENDNSGVLYHSIGVNGAKASDFNKFPLFYEQLPALHPDLVIVSLGTNESFDKQSGTQYFTHLIQMINRIKEHNPGVCVLVMTSPPSVLHRKFKNTYIEKYAELIEEMHMIITMPFGIYLMYLVVTKQ